MTFDASKYEVQEEQLSARPEVQSPVQPYTGPGVFQSVLDFVDEAVDVGIPLYQQNKANKAQEVQSKLKRDFDRKLVQAGGLADKHGSDSIQFNTFLTNAYSSSGLAPEDKTKAMKDFQATALGKSFTEKSPEEEARDELIKGAMKANFIPYNATQDQIIQGAMNFQLVSAQQEFDAARLAKIQLEQAELNLKQDKSADDRAALAAGEKEIEEGKWTALVNLSANYTPAIKNKVGEIADKYRKGDLTREQAEQQLVDEKRDFSATLGHLTAGMPTGHADPLVAPMMAVFDIGIDRLDSAQMLADIENESALMIAKSKRAQLLSSKPLVDAVAGLSLANFQSPNLIATMSNEVAKVHVRMSQYGIKPVDVTEQTEEMGSYLNTLTGAIKVEGEVKADGSPLVDPKELSTNIINTLSGANRYIDEEDSPKQNEEILKWLSNPLVGKYVGDKYSELPPKAVMGLHNTLTKSAVNHLYPQVQEIAASDLKGGEGVEMFNLNNQVVFRATSSDPWHKSVANKMNNKIAGALTTYFKAISNVSSDDFSQVFERERPVAWPKYQEEPPQGEEAKSGDVADEAEIYKKFPDNPAKVYKDSRTGKYFTVVNGVRTEGGG